MKPRKPRTARPWFDYFESTNPFVTRKMKPDPKGYAAWALRYPIEAFRRRFCMPNASGLK